MQYNADNYYRGNSVVAAGFLLHFECKKKFNLHYLKTLIRITALYTPFRSAQNHCLPDNVRPRGAFSSVGD